MEKTRTISDLPAEAQAYLNRELAKLKDINEAYRIELYNESKTRFFRAVRHQHEWHGGDGRYMRWGGGSEWSICYGKMSFRSYKSCMGTTEYNVVHGQTFKKAMNGTVIPSYVATKKEVLEVAKAIGIFNV